MKDPINSAIDLLFEEIDNHVPKSSSKVRETTKRKLVEDFDFDSYFDNLIEENFQPTIHTPQVEVKELKEEVVIEPQVPVAPAYQMMDDLTNKLTTYLDRTHNKYVEPDPQDFSVIVENLTKQIQDVRRLVLENTVVSGIGQGGDGQGPGSGEVWFKYLDDIDLNGLQDGDTIVWDQETGKWRPGKVDPEPAVCEPCIDGGPSPTNTIYEDYLSGGSIIEDFPDGVTDGGDSRDLCGC